MIMYSFMFSRNFNKLLTFSIKGFYYLFCCNCDYMMLHCTLVGTHSSISHLCRGVDNSRKCFWLMTDSWPHQLSSTIGTIRIICINNGRWSTMGKLYACFENMMHSIVILHVHVCMLATETKSENTATIYGIVMKWFLQGVFINCTYYIIPTAIERITWKYYSIQDSYFSGQSALFIM